MLETALTAFTTFFAVIGPIDTAVLLASLTAKLTRAERRAIAVKAVFIATVIILAFALVGGRCCASSASRSPRCRPPSWRGAGLEGGAG